MNDWMDDLKRDVEVFFKTASKEEIVQSLKDAGCYQPNNEKKFLDTFSSVREAVEELLTEDDFLPAFSKVEFDEL